MLEHGMSPSPDPRCALQPSPVPEQPLRSQLLPSPAAHNAASRTSQQTPLARRPEQPRGPAGAAAAPAAPRLPAIRKRRRVQLSEPGAEAAPGGDAAQDHGRSRPRADCASQTSQAATRLLSPAPAGHGVQELGRSRPLSHVPAGAAPDPWAEEEEAAMRETGLWSPGSPVSGTCQGTAGGGAVTDSPGVAGLRPSWPAPAGSGTPGDVHAACACPLPSEPASSPVRVMTSPGPAPKPIPDVTPEPLLTAAAAARLPSESATSAARSDKRRVRLGQRLPQLHGHLSAPPGPSPAATTLCRDPVPQPLAVAGAPYACVSKAAPPAAVLYASDTAMPAAPGDDTPPGQSEATHASAPLGAPAPEPMCAASACFDDLSSVFSFM